ITSGGSYTVDVAFGTCIVQTGIAAEYAPPLPTGGTLLQCDENADGRTVYNLADIASIATGNTEGVTITGYYLSQANANASTSGLTTTVPFHNTAPNQHIYVAIKNQYGCKGIATVVLSTPGSAFSAIVPLEACDIDGTDDGLFSFDLTDTETAILASVPAGLTLGFYRSYNDALLQQDALVESLFTTTQPGTQTLYARINNGIDCFGIAQIPLTVHYFGTLGPQDIYLCDKSPTTINAPGGMAGYTWNTTPLQTGRSITVTQAGTYTVTLTSPYGCNGSKTYTVLASGVAKGADFVIDDFKGGNNSLIITPRGAGLYEYSLDGIRYQQVSLFSNLAEGGYTVHIRDTNGCGPEYKDILYILDYPVFFTPNNDGINDVWKINNLKKRPALLVRVCDRYGKPIISFKGDTGWDGTLNGIRLPATDYWFTITLENGRVVKGHFSLIR
ncbi:MAG: T9SS type B sorting domain-containing protein, partial [Bacteroidota bacterium]